MSYIHIQQAGSNSAFIQMSIPHGSLIASEGREHSAYGAGSEKRCARGGGAESSSCDRRHARPRAAFTQQGQGKAPLRALRIPCPKIGRCSCT